MARQKAEGPKSFSFVLSDRIRVEDRPWDFRVPALPPPRLTNEARLMKRVSVIADKESRTYQILLRFEPIKETRAIRGYPLDSFILVSVADFRPFPRHQQSRQTTQPATPRECVEYVTRLLRGGIILNGIQYNFYGHSNSQLKSRTCLLHAATKQEISRMVEAFGDFSKMKTVAKKAKRLGLLFSDARAAVEVSPDRCEDIADVETSDYIFTDGCGLISPRLAQELARRTGIMFRSVRYTPSVYQLRYRGYKGVVAVDPTMRDGKTLLKLRRSMKKFSGGDDYSFCVVEYSKPYVFGNLNDETVLLLYALGIPRNTILKKQEEHLSFLAEALHDPRAAFRLLSYLNMPDLAEKILIDSLESVRPRVAKLIRAEYDKMLNKKDEQKCRILISKSRLLFGVCDAWEVLKEGECAVRVTMDGDGAPRALTGTEVIVTRNPCLHPGDIQKLKVVERRELAHLVDCIVFPTTGRRSPADMMSGGDLDGDTFFVCWDPDLIPSTVSYPAEYPGARESLKFSPITDDDRLLYFAKYSNSSLGRVKNLYLDWAKVKGPMSAECQQLNRLFSQCVDGNQIRVPPKLEKAPSPPEDAEAFILDELHSAAKQIIANHSKSSDGVNQTQVEGSEFDAIELLLARDDLAISEFELIKMTQTWCRKHGACLEDFLDFFDFNILAADEKAWVLSQLVPTVEAPSLITNALYSSNLLDVSELMEVNLHHSGLRWKCVYDSSRHRLATFLDSATANLELFHRKLIVFRADERLTLAVYVPLKIERSQDCQVDNRVRLLAFPHSKGPQTSSRLTLPTKMNYRLFCDEHAFQLFEGQRANTWIYLARGPSDDSSYRNTTGVGDRRRQRQSTIDAGVNYDCRASVALDKFSKNLQQHVGRINRNGITAAEIYVISNRDVKSMQSLDLWLEYIDTGEKWSLFEQSAREYTIPRLSDVNWPEEPPYLYRIVKEQDLSVFGELKTSLEHSFIFRWLLERDEKDMLLRCFDFLLAHFRISEETPGLVEPPAVLKVMLDTLKRAPYLAISFSRSPHWSEMPAPLVDMLETSAVDIIKAFILSATEVEGLVVAPLQAFLSRVRRLEMEDYAELVEVIALVVRSPEMAFDLILQCLESESARIVPGRPAIVRHLVRSVKGIAMDHIEEAMDQCKTRPELLELGPLLQDEGGYDVVEVSFRIDTKESTPETSAHVRLIPASFPTNVPVGKTSWIDAIVQKSQQGFARLRCFHPLPTFFQRCSWKLQYCGSFVTTKTMMDAVRTFAVERESSCGILEQLLATPCTTLSQEPDLPRPAYSTTATLNASQTAAVGAALAHPLTCLWGPPGTGKTETIVEIIRVLQESFRDSRIIVTAPTHNAVDNVMRRYLKRAETRKLSGRPEPYALRVSTEVRKVAEDLRKHTCDAMAGQDIYTSHRAMKEAGGRIAKCQIIFTTCIGAGLGLLRSQVLDIVVIDEASQQTEPASLVPLTKGCRNAVLVGDHVQLRPTVGQNAAALEFDISLFERLYTQYENQASSYQGAPGGGADRSVARLMLDTQYRMHRTICDFVSTEFYEGKLHTGVADDSRPLPCSQFPWPSSASGDQSRMIFVECASGEDLGHKSKTNRGQASICLQICKMLYTEGAIVGGRKGSTIAQQSIAVLTPYARQAELLKQMLAGLPYNIEVSSIDGFQGREADIVIFVTVRCNQHCEIGFLKDLRRMNVALTRCRAGLIVIGHRNTLTAGDADPTSTSMLRRLLDRTVQVEVALEAEGPPK